VNWPADFGYGGVLAAALQLYEGACRGSGRTHRVLTGLKEGDVLIVAHEGIARTCRSELKRLAKFNTVALLEEVLDGRRRFPSSPLILDHTASLLWYQHAVSQATQRLSALAGCDVRGPEQLTPAARFSDFRS
jgi:hypothetical protein